MNRKMTYLLGASLAMLAGAQLDAQTAANGAAVPKAAATGGVPDIVTTATKVETTLQKNPQTVSTILGPVLNRQGVSTLQSLSKLVSGLQVEQNSGGGAAIYIRGIGSRVLSPSGDPAVAFSVDGVYYARTVGTSAPLFDVARVEVVKGPQGTLYGRNATGGAVNVISNHPVLGERSMEGELEVGNYAAVRAMAAVNLPIGDNAAIRVAGQSLYHNGYLSDGYDDEDTKSARASLVYKPHDAFSLYVSADYAHQGGMGSAGVPIGPTLSSDALTTRFAVPGKPFTGPSDPRINGLVNTLVPPQAIAASNAGILCAGMPVVPVAAGASPVGAPAIPFCSYPLGTNQIKPNGYLDNDVYGANVTADMDVGFGRLTAVGGYRGTSINGLHSLAGPASVEDARDKINQFSGELRLGSRPSSGRIKWLVGAFYLREQQNATTVATSSNFVVPNPFPVPGSPVPATACVAPLGGGLCLVNANTQSYGVSRAPHLVSATAAGFAQATYTARPWLRLTGGIRFTHEEKLERDGSESTVYSVPAGVTTSFPSQGSAKFNNVSYRAGIDADIAPQSLLFATYSTAFHAGGFNSGLEQGPNLYQYKPEKVTSYAIGIKNRFFGNRVQFNVEAFWLDYGNYQQYSLGRLNDGSVGCSQQGLCPLGLRIDNAASARIRGVEAGLVVVPIANTTFNVNVLYNDARFRDYDATSVFDGSTISYAGRRLPGAYPLTITGGINKALPLANGGRLIADARTQYRRGTYLWFAYSAPEFQKSYTRTDVSLTYELPGDHLSITGFVRNVENKATIIQGAPIDSVTGLLWTPLNPPRTFGGLVAFKF